MQTPLDWGELRWTVARVHLLKPEGEAGKSTHGSGRVYSSLAQRLIPGLSFLALSLVDVQQRRSYPLRVEQRLPDKQVETVAPASKRGEDFMNVAPTAVTKATNLAFLMVNASAVLLQPCRQHQPDFGVRDLKTHFRAHLYLLETINSFLDPPAPHLVSRLWQRFSSPSGIRPPAHLEDAAQLAK